MLTTGRPPFCTVRRPNGRGKQCAHRRSHSSTGDGRVVRVTCGVQFAVRRLRAQLPTAFKRHGRDHRQPTTTTRIATGCGYCYGSFLSQVGLSATLGKQTRGPTACWPYSEKLVQARTVKEHKVDLRGIVTKPTISIRKCELY